MVPADWQDRGMHHGAAMKDDDVSSAAANVDKRDAELALFGKQRRVRRGERLKDHLGRSHARALATLGEIQSVTLRGGHDMNSRLESHPRHPERLPPALPLIDGTL